MAIILNGDTGISTPDVEPTSSTVPTNGLYLPAANSVGIATNSTNAVYINSSQNVGIGVTPSAWDTYANNIQTPTGAMVSYSPSSNFGMVQNAYYQSGWKYSTSNFASFYLQSSGVHSWSYASSGTAGNAVTFNEAVRIDSSGNLLVGTTTANGLLSVTKATDGSTAHIYNTTSAFTSVNMTSRVDRAATTAYVHFAANSNGTAVCYIYGNGNIQNTNNSYGAISDAKLKENIIDATPKLADLMQVKVRSYNLIGNAQKQIGVVAQELEQVFPGMVDESSDRDAEGNDLGTTTKSVKYSVFVPMLIKAIQEQQTIIEQLKARLDAAGL